MEETDRKPTLNGLVETAFFVEDLPRACDFYEQVLGLSKVKASRYRLRVSRGRPALSADLQPGSCAHAQQDSEW